MNIENKLRTKLQFMVKIEEAADSSPLGKLIKRDVKLERRNIQSLMSLLKEALDKKFPDNGCIGPEMFFDYEFELVVTKKESKTIFGGPIC